MVGDGADPTVAPTAAARPGPRRPPGRWRGSPRCRPPRRGTVTITACGRPADGVEGVGPPIGLPLAPARRGGHRERPARLSGRVRTPLWIGPPGLPGLGPGLGRRPQSLLADLHREPAA